MWKNQETGEVEWPYYLIGMVQGSHGGRYENDIPEEVAAKDADFNAGIATVLPYPLIMEVIDNPVLKERRMAAIEASKKRSGSRPSSAPKSTNSAEAGPDDPQSKERFTALLNAASRKKPQGS